MRSWFRFDVRAAANDAAPETAAEIFIYGEIGPSFWDDDAVSAKAFVDELAALPDTVKTLNIHINSPGGYIFDGVTIANAIRDQHRTKGRTVDVFVDGLAASAASLVAMGGQRVVMADNALMFVHLPWVLVVGNAAELRKVADELDQIKGPMVTTYQWHSPLSDAAIVALMEAETWMDADTAIEKGFATEKVEGLEAAAKLDARAVAKLKVPAQYRDRIAALIGQPGMPPAPAPAPTPAPAPAPSAVRAQDVARICRESDCVELIEELLDAATVDVVTARVETRKREKADAAARETAIRQLCAHVRLSPARASRYITSNLSLSEIRADVAEVSAYRDNVEIDGVLMPIESAGKPAISAIAIYKKRNAPLARHSSGDDAA